MVAPKPQDPSRPSISPEELAEKLDGIFDEPAGSLAAEAEQLEAAHQILNDALQNN